MGRIYKVFFAWWSMKGQWSSFEDGKDIRGHVYSRIFII